MNVIGDIERLVADLWPLRVPIGIGLIVVIVALGVVAWRRGWFEVAKAHPRASLAAVIVLLIIAIPSGWVLGSPLFIRTELVEETPTATAGASAILLEGELSGADDFHFGSGQTYLVATAPGELTLSFENLSVLNGPDLFVYVSPDPEAWTEEAVNLGSLKATDGSFSYEVPPDVDIADIASVVIWCKAFGVLFASAPLEPSEPATA